MKKCPFCAEEIQDEAILCRYCGSRLDLDVEVILPPVEPESIQIENKVSEQEPNEESTRTGSGTNWGLSIVLGILFSILAVIPKLIEFINVSEEVQKGRYDALVLRVILQDIGFHLIINAFIWLLIIALLIWIWRKNKNFILVLAVIGIIGVFIFNIIDLKDIDYQIPSKPTDISHTIIGHTSTIKPTIKLISAGTSIPTRNYNIPTATSIYADLPNMNEIQIQDYCMENTGTYFLFGTPDPNLTNHMIEECIKLLTTEMNSR